MRTLSNGYEPLPLESVDDLGINPLKLIGRMFNDQGQHAPHGVPEVEFHRDRDG